MLLVFVDARGQSVRSKEEKEVLEHFAGVVCDHVMSCCHPSAVSSHWFLYDILPLFLISGCFLNCQSLSSFCLPLNRYFIGF